MTIHLGGVRTPLCSSPPTSPSHRTPIFPLSSSQFKRLFSRGLTAVVVVWCVVVIGGAGLEAAAVVGGWVVGIIVVAVGERGGRRCEVGGIRIGRGSFFEEREVIGGILWEVGKKRGRDKGGRGKGWEGRRKRKGIPRS